MHKMLISCSLIFYFKKAALKQTIQIDRKNMK